MKLVYALVAVALTVLLNTLIIMACWNYVAPAVFGLKTLTFFQALVLATLIRSLKGGDVVKYSKE